MQNERFRNFANMMWAHDLYFLTISAQVVQPWHRWYRDQAVATAMAEQIIIHKDDIVMEGFMVKQSKHLKEWRQRWFVLTPEYLCSFKSQGDYTNPTEYIRLAECSTVKSAEETTGKENSFCVQTTQRSFCLIARSAAEKEQWISRVGRQMVRRAVLIEDDYEWSNETSAGKDAKRCTKSFRLAAKGRTNPAVFFCRFCEEFTWLLVPQCAGLGVLNSTWGWCNQKDRDLLLIHGSVMANFKD